METWVRGATKKFFSGLNPPPLKLSNHIFFLFLDLQNMQSKGRSICGVTLVVETLANGLSLLVVFQAIYVHNPLTGHIKLLISSFLAPLKLLNNYNMSLLRETAPPPLYAPVPPKFLRYKTLILNALIFLLIREAAKNFFF